MRSAKITRTTKETDIIAKLNIDGESKIDIDTGIGFFDHMLTALAVHAGWDLTLKCKGDLYVDSHHTIEDCGITLGQALNEILNDKSGIMRYGNAAIPMDETLVSAAIDISGRPYCVFNCDFTYQKIGEMDTQMVEEFFKAFSFNAKITMHINLMYGTNDHHKAEACFKAVAHAIKQALSKNVDNTTVLSSKGML